MILPLHEFQILRRYFSFISYRIWSIVSERNLLTLINKVNGGKNLANQLVAQISDYKNYTGKRPIDRVSSRLVFFCPIVSNWGIQIDKFQIPTRLFTNV